MRRAALLDAAGLGDGSLPDLIEHARAGNPHALAAIADCGRWLGIGLASAVNLLAPPAIVLGGDFAALAPWLAPAVTQELRVRVFGRTAGLARTDLLHRRPGRRRARRRGQRRAPGEPDQAALGGEVGLDEARPLGLVLAPALLGALELPVAGDRQRLGRPGRARRSGGGAGCAPSSPRRARTRGRGPAAGRARATASASSSGSSPGAAERCSQVRRSSPGESSGCCSSSPSISITTWTGTPAGMRGSAAEIAGMTLASPASRCQSASGSGVYAPPGPPRSISSPGWAAARPRAGDAGVAVDDEVDGQLAALGVPVADRVGARADRALAIGQARA